MASEVKTCETFNEDLVEVVGCGAHALILDMVTGVFQRLKKRVEFSLVINLWKRLVKHTERTCEKKSKMELAVHLLIKCLHDFE